MGSAAIMGKCHPAGPTPLRGNPNVQISKPNDEKQRGLVVHRLRSTTCRRYSRYCLQADWKPGQIQCGLWPLEFLADPVTLQDCLARYGRKRRRTDAHPGTHTS